MAKMEKLHYLGLSNCSWLFRTASLKEAATCQQEFLNLLNPAARQALLKMFVLRTYEKKKFENKFCLQNYLKQTNNFNFCW